MRKNIFLTSAVALIIITQGSVIAQGDSTRTRDGIVARYSMSLLDRGNKNDRYRIVLRVVNTNPFDVYYGKTLRKQPNGSMGLDASEDLSFARVRIYNTSGLEGFLGQMVSVSGEDTKLLADGNMQLFRMAAGKALENELAFTVRAGKTPNIALIIDGGIMRQNAFRIHSGMGAGSGDWVSNCGNVGMFLTQTTNSAGQPVLEQTVNNRRQTWIQISEGIFEKTNDNTARVTYNKAGNIYTYSNDDGATCIWSKK